MRDEQKMPYLQQLTNKFFDHSAVIGIVGLGYSVCKYPFRSKLPSSPL